MSVRVYYRGGGFEVNEALLKTPRKSYALERIEYVSVTRPLLLFTGPPAIGLIGFALSFWRYLHWGEIFTLAGLSAAALILATRVGTLRVHSLALRDDEVAQSFGPIDRLRAVRGAVEAAMARRGGKGLALQQAEGDES